MTATQKRWLYAIATIAAIIGVAGVAAVASARKPCMPTTSMRYEGTVKLVENGKVVSEWKAAELLRHGGETWGGAVMWQWRQPDGTEVSVLVGKNSTLVVEEGWK